MYQAVIAIIRLITHERCKVLVLYNVLFPYDWKHTSGLYMETFTLDRLQTMGKLGSYFIRRTGGQM